RRRDVPEGKESRRRRGARRRARCQEGGACGRARAGRTAEARHEEVERKSRIQVNSSRDSDRHARQPPTACLFEASYGHGVTHTTVEDAMFPNRFRRRIPALVSALALCAVSAGAASQGLSPGATPGGSVSTGAARSGPALAPTPATAPTCPAPATPPAATPLPGQSTLPSQLPPLNANGMGQ